MRCITEDKQPAVRQPAPATKRPLRNSDQNIPSRLQTRYPAISGNGGNRE
ncbi:MAG: hypothetical protein LBS03_00055 [Bacteroidales bacterium]|nr:hypothetical protein [Bacteroidales bacterium]